LVGLSYFGKNALDKGNAFLLKPPASGQTAWIYKDIYDFQGGNDGSYPMASVIAGPNGVLYGTTTEGGTANAGTVYSLTPPHTGHPNWTETVLYSFQSGSDGATPEASLTLGKNGILYGTTKDGGIYGSGTVFSLSPPVVGSETWTETILLPFNFNDGYFPVASLIITVNGSLIGAASGGGTNNTGQIFELTPPTNGSTAWTDTTLYQFTGGNDGGLPEGAVLASGKTYFGTAIRGGKGDDGVIFSLTSP